MTEEELEYWLNFVIAEQDKREDENIRSKHMERAKEICRY